jgi:tripartite-type tricarboxylate transporter receptor subunit TctC
MPDLLAGRIAMLIDGVPAQAKNIESGLVRVAGGDHQNAVAALACKVPTMIEQGLTTRSRIDGDLRPQPRRRKPILDRLRRTLSRR